MSCRPERVIDRFTHIDKYLNLYSVNLDPLVSTLDHSITVEHDQMANKRSYGYPLIALYFPAEITIRLCGK